MLDASTQRRSHHRYNHIGLLAPILLEGKDGVRLQVLLL